jgi:hypothetical protein
MSYEILEQLAWHVHFYSSESRRRQEFTLSEEGVFMKAGMVPEICTGTYFPLRGRPQRGYYVVLDEIVLAGPFARKCDANEQLKGIFQRSVNCMMSKPVSSRNINSTYSRSINSVLREQEKALSAAMGTAS